MKRDSLLLADLYENLTVSSFVYINLDITDIATREVNIIKSVTMQNKDYFVYYEDSFTEDCFTNITNKNNTIRVLNPT